MGKQFTCLQRPHFATLPFFFARRSGLLLAVYPEHDPATQLELEDRVWSSFLAPVTAFRLVLLNRPGWLQCVLGSVYCGLFPAATGQNEGLPLADR